MATKKTRRPTTTRKPTRTPSRRSKSRQRRRAPRTPAVSAPPPEPVTSARFIGFDFPIVLGPRQLRKMTRAQVLAYWREAKRATSWPMQRVPAEPKLPPVARVPLDPLPKHAGGPHAVLTDAALRDAITTTPSSAALALMFSVRRRTIERRRRRLGL